MALSDRQILKWMKKGDIVIYPFKKENLCTSSYDVSLGQYYYREQIPSFKKSFFNIWSKDGITQVWGNQALEAQKARIVFQHMNFDFEGIDREDRVIIIGPGETILGHTQEFIGGKKHITSKMQARSSMGRVFIEVCKCAGWGDVGFTNRWTMEITNNSHYSIPLVVGRRIAQIIFFETGPILNADYSKTGKYQDSDDLEKLKENWCPEMMLPQLWKDRDIKGKK